jgi:hypothetical protein
MVSIGMRRISRYGLWLSVLVPSLVWALSPAEPWILETQHQPQQASVGQQVILIWRVLSAHDAIINSIQPPTEQQISFDWLLLAEQRDTVTRNGRLYQRLEHRYALFFYQPGQQRLPPLRVTIWSSTTKQHVLTQAPDVITIVPAADPDAPQWLPARQVSLTEIGASTVRMQPDDSVIRSLLLRAEGLLAQQLPAIPLVIPKPLSGQALPPLLWNEFDAHGVIGYRLQRWRITANHSATVTLPAEPTITWWNCDTQQASTAIRPAWTLMVQPMILLQRFNAMP